MIEWLYLFSTTIIPYNEAPFWFLLLGVAVGIFIGVFFIEVRGKAK